MELIQQLAMKEWNLFQQVQNEGGRAGCQNNLREFLINRTAQFATWDEATCRSYEQDLDTAQAQGRNLLTEKYARMMEYTAPAEYAALRDRLPAVSAEQEQLVKQIVAIQLVWQVEFSRRYPKLSRGARPTSSAADGGYTTSFETYLRSELLTYSVATLRAYLAHAQAMCAQGVNMTIQNLDYNAKLYGFTSIDEMEKISK